MKPIDQMTLAEATSTVRNISQYANTDPFVDANGRPWVYDALHELADRIHDLTRWIPVSERMPTEEDVDENGEVIAYSPDPAITVSASGIPPSHHFTHWKRLTPPEDKP